MISEDDFQYAVENTEVILSPERKIATFGETRFRFYLVSELLDSVDEVRVRDGWLHAERPQILAPGHHERELLEGFGEKARAFLEAMSRQEQSFAFVKYGFQFRKTDVVENLAHNPIDAVIDEVKSRVASADEPLTAIIRGVDDTWEVSLLKFSIDLIQESVRGNFGDFKNRGLL